jgi:hypothetical protein
MSSKSPAKKPGLRILTIREQKVALDSELAAIYGVPTGRFNEAVKRNLKRFPVDFSFVLSRDEFGHLISQNAISKPARGGRTKIPRVFTEHGALMAASILNSERAIAMSVYVIRAFVELRERLAANAAILKRLAEIDHELLLHNTALQDSTRNSSRSSPRPLNRPARRSGFLRPRQLRGSHLSSRFRARRIPLSGRRFR